MLRASFNLIIEIWEFTFTYFYFDYCTWKDLHKAKLTKWIFNIYFCMLLFQFTGEIFVVVWVFVFICFFCVGFFGGETGRMTY